MDRRRFRRRVWGFAVALLVVGSATAGSQAGFAAGVPVTAATLTTFQPTELPKWCGGTETISASADSWIDQAAPDATNGADTTLAVAALNRGARRTLVSFPLATGCAVATATLRLHNGTATNGRTIQVYRGDRAWTEGAVTWNTRPSPSASTAAATATSAGGWMQWDVTAHVAAMTTGANYGFIVRDMDEGGGAIKQQSFSSRDGANPPQLVVQWQP